MIFLEKTSSVLRSITVEPALFFYFLSVTILDILDTNLYLNKACRWNTTSEPNLDLVPCDDETQGILIVSTINGNYRFWEMIVMLMVMTVLFSWSDEAGKKRKLIVILPIVGLLGQSISGCLHSYFWAWSPVWAAAVDLASQAFSGGYLLMFFACQLYVCDITDVADRTMRTGILLSVTNVCIPIGNTVGGFLIRDIGFFNSFAVCAVLSTMSLVSAVILVEDTVVPVPNEVSVLGLFKFGRIVDSFNVTFKKSLGRKRIVVGLLLAVHVVVLFSNDGEKSVFYLWLRHKFKWDEKMFSVYQTYKLVGVIVGTMFCSIVLSKMLKIHDGIIGTFAGFWDMLAALAYVFASQEWHLYLIPLLDIFHGTALAICFSFLTKFYDSEEFGRLIAVFTSCTLFFPFCLPVYNYIFQSTLDNFPPAVFVTSVIVDFVVCLLYGGSYILTKKFEAEEQAKFVQHTDMESGGRDEDSPQQR